MPKMEFDSVEVIPEGLRETAIKTESGKFQIDVAPISKLNEFRDNNITLSQERDGLKANLGQLTGMVSQIAQVIGVTPDKLDLKAFGEQWSKLNDTAKQVADGKLVASTSLEEALTTRTTEMKTAHERALAELTADRDTWKNKATTLDEELRVGAIDRAITEAFLKPEIGGRPEALPDILTRARATYKVKEGKLIPYDKDGKIIYDAEAKPLQPEGWLKSLRASAGYFFKESNGGGANGSPGGAGSGGPGGSSTVAWISREDAKDVLKYRAAREAAAKAGKVLQVAPEAA